MDFDFLRAIAAIENIDSSYCILKRDSQVFLHTQLEHTYNSILDVPDNSYVTGYQNYDSTNGQWCTWKNIQKFTKYDCDNKNESIVNDVVRKLEWQTNIDDKEFQDICKRMIDDMSKGEYFLANLTRKLILKAEVDPIKVAIQSTIDHDCEFRYFFYSPNISYLSLSPESFIKIKDGTIVSKPIKGTAKTYDELHANEKDREENTMIVDLVRSDFAKISTPESIKVKDFQNISEHPGLVQMSSSIVASIDENKDIRDCISGLMPIASVSGTPKPRVIKKIKEYENIDRGIYCGAIGWVDTNKSECELSVAIRGIEFRQNEISIGVGSGITARSNPEKEFLETELKASRLIKLVEDNVKAIPESIFTTTYINDMQELFAMQLHISRLENAAKIFNINTNRQEIINKIKNYIYSNKCREGKLTISIDTSNKITISHDENINAFNIFQKLGVSISSPEEHSDMTIKSMPRNAYNEHLRQAQLCAENNIDECLILHKCNLIESTRANIFVRFGNKVITPPLDNRYLNGIFRQIIITEFKEFSMNLIEDNINIADLDNADEIILANSLRGASLIQSVDSLLYPALKAYKPKDDILKKYLDSLFNSNLEKLT
jgi:anthranilate/para-aminobenzoate synthase component I/branched-subunit amino acid aminotransferase/4-amino-4-deoxychorismate lyase